MSNPLQSHDSKLEEIMKQEGDSIPAFFNAVFGFLSRYCPEKIYDSSQISGEHLLNQSFCKWREKHLQDKIQKVKQAARCEEVEAPPVAAEEVVITQSQEDLCQDTKQKITMRSKTADNSEMNAVNGAVKDLYAWTQTIDDLEVRVPVPQNIKKGKQVKVQLQTSSLEVNILEGAAWRTMVTGHLAYTIRVEESLWSLVPGEHILINLEKKDERWWDKLLLTEDPIDLKKINAERDFNTLPQEEQEKIRELVWNKQQQEQGKPTSDTLKMESMLREAWDAEGSPFKGQTYDPSLINFTTGSHFGAG